MNRPIRVLHVDDNPELADVAATFLEREDDRFDVQIATSVQEALDSLAEREFDCIVSDYDMPSQNGIEFLQLIRAEWGDLPFILYTGKGSEEIASEAISAGVTDYLQKESGTEQYKILANRIANAVEKSRSEQLASRTKRQLTEIAENANDILWLFSGDWSELLFVNSAYEDIFGGSVSELEENPTSFIDDIHPADRDRVEEAMERLTAGEDVDIEYRVNEGEDYGRWVWVQASPIFDEKGAVIRISGFARDISDRKTREARLQKTTQRLEATIEASPDPIVVFDEDATVELWNTAAEQVFGYSANEVVGEQFTELGIVPPDRVEAFTRRLSRAFDGEAYTGIEVKRRTKDGDSLNLILSKAPVYDTDGSIRSVVTVKKDISEQKRLEERLRQENKRLEEFASIVSHDLRNPLNVAISNLELAQAEFQSEYLDNVGQAHERMETLIEDLLTLARQGEHVTSAESVALDRVVERCWQSVQTSSATLTTETECAIQADQNRLRQLLENLFRNAVEHGSDDVTVTVGELDDASGFYVADDGPGIPADEHEDVFDPGYSTSEEGTGFGLSIVKQVVEAHGWDIQVTASESGGARFEISGIEPSSITSNSET